MKKGVNVWGVIAVSIVIGSLFMGIVSTEVIVADVNKDIAATNVNVTQTSPKGDLELVRGDDETETSTKNKTERIKVTPTSTHDMVVTKVNTTPSSPDLEQPTVIYVTVTNEGEQQEDNVSVKVYVDSAQIGSTQYISLAPGSSNTTTFLWSPTTAKAYSVKGEVEIVNGEIDVKDNTKRVKVTVSAVPTPTPTPTPTAIIDSITPDPAVQGTDTVSFSGNGTDTDGTVEAYNWGSSIDGQLSTSAAFTKQASELSVGTHAIYFKVQDNDGAWSTEATADLTINPANVPPTAIIDSITPDPAVQGTDTVSFSGNGTDIDGTVEAYNWSSSIDGQLSTSAAFTKQASELSVGTHTIYFKVQDNDGAWSTEATADLTINPANVPPTAIIDSITPDPAEQGTDTVSFSGHGTDTDGTVAAYNWSSSIDGPLSTSAAFTKPASELSIGTHTIYFKVQDNDGMWSTEDTEDLTINPANQQPTAIIDSVTPDPAVQGADTVSFSGHGTDTDGTVEAYNWSSSIDGQLSTSAAFTKQAAELSVGTHTIYFKVQDDDGAWSTEDTADLTIYPGPELSYSPESHEFGDMREGETDNTTFEIWNSGTDTLTYSLSETCDWLEVYPTSGSSTGEHNAVTVDMDTTGLFEGSHTGDIKINSNDGSGTFTVMVNVVDWPESSGRYKVCKWTYMVYLDGDNNLEGAGIDDFMEMSSVGSTSDVNIVVQFDRIPGYDSSYGDWTTCKRFHVTSGMTPTAANAISDLGECNMGAPNTLRDFVDWAMTNFPADNYALILWNHGDGWKSINDWVPWADDTKDAKDAGLSRGICVDNTNNDYLSLQETEVALTGKYVQLLGYDACLMHMVEVVYQVMTNAGVSVGSEEVEPWDGWPYDTILNDLTGMPTMNEDALGTVIVDRYMASYPTRNDLTQSAVDNYALPNLVTAVDNLAQVLINEINGGHWTQVQQARYAAEEIYYSYYIDLYHFAEKIPLYVPSATAQAQAVMDSMWVAVYEEAHGTSVLNDHGLSIYFPRVEGDYLASYDNTAFASDTQWNEFLKKYYNPSTQGEDIAVYSNGWWFVDTTRDHIADQVFLYGAPGNTPIVGDINQFGTDDTAVFSDGLWSVDTTGNHIADMVFLYGAPGHVPLVGDINQDGLDDTAVFSNGWWFVDTTGNHIADLVFLYGAPGHVPVVGDINQDGTDDTAVFSDGLWFVDTTGNHIADMVFLYGGPGNTPVVGDVNQDETDDTAVFSNGWWFVDINGNHIADQVFLYGAPGSVPLVGDIG